ncbi:conserved protein of unknown function [Pseudodesulfovibrio profundus]|uniref:Amphi-Trp domain-containing protein n=1 Tax=Pseudodesulfovibrio profundus TaxID=57320 RepID=A0A2C8FAH1_9BACT|nr:amphi-Trp domain-containing protein [Pseudodesulfovibrio profundus]MBC17637.1 amphi-Trp domain-containing protein [Desulfovibrio sp.]SOB59027.1 conserved protein of unknown function [Pseudodesulfovibrio profundus]|tara:strand:+ start:1824 stop:2099 length:276 start_codon:yes stop_codon:yes gene_type:complete
MGRETILFKSEEKKSATEVAQALRLVADKIEEGSITLSQGGESLVLHLPSTMSFEIKAEEEEGRTKTKRSLEFELEWTLGEEEENGGATIS